MRIVWQNDRFQVEGKDTYDNKETLKKCGFKWDGEKKVWYCDPATQRLAGLRPIQPSITPEAKAKFEEYENARQAFIETSRASDSNIDIPCPKGLAYLGYQKAGIAYALRAFGDLK